MKIKRIIPALLWSGIIFFLCFLPGSSLPKEDWLDKIYFDKIVHAILYFILFFLIIYGVRQAILSQKNQILLASTLCILQGVVIEVVQGSSLIQHRSFDIYDIVANIFGVLIAIAFFYRKHKIK